jgi:hypothetical protein
VSERSVSVAQFCWYCGATTRQDARFCAECGTPQHSDDSLPATAAGRSAHGGQVVTAPPRDFTSSAVLTMLLYFVLWVPGLLANLAYLESANGERARIGRDPQGRGCLVSLLWVFLGIPLLVLGECVAFWVLHLAVVLIGLPLVFVGAATVCTVRQHQ